MDVEIHLVQLVKANPLLYVKSRREFKNIIEKENIWTSIAQIVGMSVSDCKNRWIRLRERFTRELKSEKLSLKNGGPPGSQWPLYEHILFLKDHIKERIPKGGSHSYNDSVPNSLGGDNIWDPFDEVVLQESEEIEQKPLIDTNIIATEFLNVERVSTPDEGREPEVEVQHTMSTESQDETSNSSTESSKRCRKRKRSSAEDAINSLLGHMNEFLRNKKTDDSDMAFGRFVGMSLKELPKSKKTALRLKIIEAIEEVDNL